MVGSGIRHHRQSQRYLPRQHGGDVHQIFEYRLLLSRHIRFTKKTLMARYYQ